MDRTTIQGILYKAAKGKKLIKINEPLQVYQQTVESVFNSEFITNTTFRKSFCLAAVCCGDSFKFLLQPYDLPDSGCILPRLKALLQFGRWILFVLLLRRLLTVHAGVSFYC